MFTCARKLTEASSICRLKWTLLIVAAKQATWPIHCHPSREENGEQARMEARGEMGRGNEMGEHERGREGVKGRKEEEREKKKEEKNGETSDKRKWKEGDGRRRRDERRGERERERDLLRQVRV